MGDKKAQKQQAAQAQKEQKEKDKEKDNAAKEPGSSSNKVVIALLIVAIVILLTMGAGFGFLYIKGAFNKTQAAPVAKETVQVKESVSIKKLQLDEFVTNLADGNNTYVKIKIALGYVTTDTATELKNKADEVRNTINMTLMSKKSSDLKGNNLPGVINELIEKINALLIKGKVTNIYIDNILIS